ncbi:MAG: glycosyltransferase [Gammaproteobacteria bacterium]|nr:glycosyltransferase [Gammaproteobacteria bacterium]
MGKIVLIVSYVFPPVGGAGVQRATKFVKYLPEFGWQPIVLTAQNPSVPIFDKSLLGDVAANVKIIKAKTYEPAYKAKAAVSASTQEETKQTRTKSLFKNILRQFANLLLQPDPQILWYPEARREANRFLTENRVDAILATGPPFTSFLLGSFLAKKHGIPLILDYRDEWDISNKVLENKNLGKFSLAIQKRMQNRVISRAKSVIATTKMSAQSLREKIENIGVSTSVDCIYNGFDVEDFKHDRYAENAKGSKYLLTYVGTLWNLTSIAPVVTAIKKLVKDYPSLSSSLEFVVAGRRTAEQDAILDRLSDSAVSVIRHDYLDHDSAIKLMLDSQGLCLTLSDLNSAERVVPAKVFEYVACRNSIFVIAPKGEVWQLLSDYPRAFFAEPADIESITKFIVNDIRRFINEGNCKVSSYDASRYDRRALTGELANLLDQVVSRKSMISD